MPEKFINLSFFQLTPADTNPENEKENIKEIKNIFKSKVESYQPVSLYDGSANLYGKIELNNGYYLGTLVKNQKSNIPPSCDDENNIEVLPLGDKKGLGFATSFLYDPLYRIVMIESAPGGVGIGVLCSFLEANFTIPRLEPAIVINPIEYAKYLELGVYTKLQVKVAKLEHGEIFKSKKKNLNQALKLADDSNTNIFEFTMSVGNRKEGLTKSVIKPLINELLNFKDSKEVKTLKLSGRENEDGKSETVDFIKERLKDKFSIKSERLISSFDIPLHYNLLLEVYKKHEDNLTAYKVKAIE